MKHLLIYSLAAIFIIATGCNQSNSSEVKNTAEAKSTKGNWIQEEKMRMLNEFEYDRADMDSLFSREIVNDWRDCIMEKAEQQYENFDAFEKDSENNEQMGADCMEEIMGAALDQMMEGELDIDENEF